MQTIYVFLVLLTLGLAPASRHGNGHHSSSCSEDDYYSIELKEISSALGDDVMKPSGQRKLVDIILTGFDCESRLERLACKGQSLTCDEIRDQIIISDVNETNFDLELILLPLRLFATALNLESFACEDTVQKHGDFKHHLQLREFCTSRDFVHFRSVFNTIFHNTATLWKPELIRSQVWNRNFTNLEFINERKCIKEWPLLHYIAPNMELRYHRNHNHLCVGTPLLLEKMMIRMLTKLLKGNQLVEAGSRCPLDYALDIFKVFGRHHTHIRCDESWYMITSDLDKLLHTAETSHHSSQQAHSSDLDDDFPQPGNAHWPEYDRGWSHDRYQGSFVQSPPIRHRVHHHAKRSVWEELQERKTNQRRHDFNLQDWIPKPSVYNKHLQGKTIANAAELRKIFFHGRHRNISVKDFYEICPSLLHHVLFASSQLGSSRPRPSTPSPASDSVRQPHANLTALKPTPTKAQVYGYGSLSVLLISLCSVVGALFIKISKGASRHYIMAGMLALGIGNLCGDAVLHLLPEIIMAEKIGTDEEEDQVMLLGNADIPRHCIRMLGVLASLYGFFVLELLMSVYHDHSHEEIEVTVESSTPKRNVSRITLMKYNNTPSPGTLCTIYEDRQATPTMSSSQPGTVEIDEEVQEPIKTVKKTNSLSVKVPRSVAWMVIVGDSVHNFADGLAIGAAFSLSVTTGISTSIAVICHELPHELGDFAVLVSTGMSVKRALWLNFASSLTAFLGLYIGISAGSQDTARHWIFSVGAGMFLYVALADLIPELLRYFKRFRNWVMFLVQNFGILAGYAVMLVIAIYEDDINI